MADRRAPTAEGGFTLIELMVAMAILVGGLSALIALMTVGVSTRYSAAARQEAVWLAGRVMQQVSQDALGNPWLDDPSDGGAAPLAPREPVAVPQVPGMTYTLHFIESEARPDVVLAEVTVRWSEQGEGQVQVFRRLIQRQNPFGHRVRRMQEQRGQLPNR